MAEMGAVGGVAGQTNANFGQQNKIKGAKLDVMKKEKKKSIGESKEDSKPKNTIQDFLKKNMESAKKKKSPFGNKSSAESGTGKKMNILT